MPASESSSWRRSRGLLRRSSSMVGRRPRIRSRERSRCDQAMLVRKERRCDVLQEIRKRHLVGANPTRSGQPGRSVASLATGMQGRVQKRDGNGPGDALGARASEPCEVSLENSVSRGSKASLCQKTMSSTSQNGTGGRRPRRGLGTWRARRRWPSNLGYPCARWEHRRPKTRETKVWAGMRRGSRRGPK